jgi:hypothetical protein
MKKSLLAFIFLASSYFAIAQSKWAWSVKPFDKKVFVQNAGQFDALINEKATILYMAQLGDNLFAYFTTNGIIYRTIDFPKVSPKDAKGGDPDKEVLPPVINFLNAHWVGCNPSLTVTGEEEHTDYYTYPTGNSSSVIVNIFNKIVYHNLYPGIDAVFTFPQDSTGFEYALIVHPGANLSQVKLKYKGATSMKITPSGDIDIESGVDQIIDHAPKSFYQLGGNVASTYVLNGTEESFSASYDVTKTLVVDPWTWSKVPTMAVTKAYDLDYDNQGNVYIYGSSSTWQLQKLNAAGTILWTYNATPISTGYLGDFACIRPSGKCICTEGFNSTGMEAVEVSTAGLQTAANRAPVSLQEGWKIVWNPCSLEIVIGGGGWDAPCNAGGWVDTNDVIHPVNVLNQTAAQTGHDIALTCYDPDGTHAYMATTQSAGDPGNYNNVMVRLPSPALTPPAYYAATGYGFAESNVPFYISGGTSNGLNSMTASYNWVYIYNGATIKRCVKTTGAVNATVAASATVQQWGGLWVDACDNLYVGNNTSVQVYNNALALTATYACTSTVYGVMLSTTYTQLYACGNGFVCSMPLAAPVCVHPPLCSVVLPIELQEFNCSLASNGIKLNWSTASETNNKFFTIERSADGVNFQPITTVPGAGNSSTTLNYSYTDESPVNGVNYYRLSQTDFDGKSVSYNTTSCNINNELIGNVYPNPSTGKFSVSVNATVSEIQIYDAIGQKIYDKNLLQNSGSTIEVDLSSQPSGIYIMNVIQSGLNKVILKKLVVYPR